MTKVYEEIVDFIAGGSTPADVAEFQPSDESRRHVSELLDRQKNDSLSGEEAAELAHYLELEHIMRLAKARAHQHRP